MKPSLDNQVRAFDVPAPPIDDMWITVSFYSWLAAVVACVVVGIAFFGKGFVFGMLAGAVLSAFLVAMYCAWVAK